MDFVKSRAKPDLTLLLLPINNKGLTLKKCSTFDTLKLMFTITFTTKKGGTGIGLYMSSLIISNTFGGKIYAQNIYKQGKPEGLKIICEIKKDQKC